MATQNLYDNDFIGSQSDSQSIMNLLSGGTSSKQYAFAPDIPMKDLIADIAGQLKPILSGTPGAIEGTEEFKIGVARNNDAIARKRTEVIDSVFGRTAETRASAMSGTMKGHVRAANAQAVSADMASETQLRDKIFEDARGRYLSMLGLLSNYQANTFRSEVGSIQQTAQQGLLKEVLSIF